MYNLTIISYTYHDDYKKEATNTTFIKLENALMIASAVEKAEDFCELYIVETVRGEIIYSRKAYQDPYYDAAHLNQIVKFFNSLNK